MKLIEKIKLILNNFVEKGGNVDDLDKKNKIYCYIKDSRIKIDGRKLTVEEKFALAGHPRKPKLIKDTKRALLEEVTKYRQNGNSFHVKRKSLPFFERLSTAIKTEQRLSGISYTHNEYMKKLGFKDYSDIYFRYSGILELSEYVDEYGFVDNYRKNPKVKAFIQDAAISLNVPVGVVVSLIGNFKLKHYFINTDYINFVKQELESYYDKYGTLRGLGSRNSELYENLRHIERYIMTEFGEDVKLDVILRMLNIDFSNTRFGEVNHDIVQAKDIEDIVTKYQTLAKQQNGKIKKRDLLQEDYNFLLKKSKRFGIYMKDLFEFYGICYEDGINVKRFATKKSNSFPYMQEMQQERDETLSQYNLNELCKEEAFELRLKICLEIYKKYKNKIFNFTFTKESGALC